MIYLYNFQGCPLVHPYVWEKLGVDTSLDATIPFLRFRFRDVQMIPKNSSNACFLNLLGIPPGPQALLFFDLLMLFFSSCLVNILLLYFHLDCSTYPKSLCSY